MAVRHRGRLVGIAPFYVANATLGTVEYRLMGGDFGMRMEPLALPGREWDVAAEIGLDLSRLVGADDEIIARPVAHDAEALESHEDRPQMSDAGAPDGQLRIGDSGEPDEPCSTRPRA